MSLPGNLALSILLRPRGPAGQAPRWSLIAGLAVVEALSGLVANSDRLQLKWPNDITLDGAKLAGILVETAATPDGSLDWLIVGIGVNLAVAPSLPARPTACLAQLGPPPSPEQAAHAILDRLSHWRRFHGDQGFASARNAWLAHAHPLGTLLEVAVAGQSRLGRFVGLDPSGALQIATDSGPMTVIAAETSLVPSGESRPGSGACRTVLLLPWQ